VRHTVDFLITLLVTNSTLTESRIDSALRNILPV